MCVEERPLRLHLGLGDSPMQVRTHVVRLWRWRIVRIAPDIEIIFVLPEFLPAHHPREPGHVPEHLPGADDLLDVLRHEVILCPTFGVLTIGVDEEHLSTPCPRLRSLRTQDEDAGRDARPIEQVRPQPDHRVEQIIVEDPRPDHPLGPAPEQHPVRHHRHHHPAGPQHSQHVLHEHQVGLLPALRAEPVPEPLPERQVLLRVVLRERRVGDHPVEPLELPALLVERSGERVPVLDIGVLDPVQEHVHLRDGPHAPVRLLPIEAQVPHVPLVLVQVLPRQDQHPARARARVVDVHPLVRRGDAHHHPDHRARRIELATLLSRPIGEVADQVLVRGPEQVRVLEVLVAQPVLREMVDEVPQVLVRDLRLAHLPREVDVREHAVEARVLRLQRAQRLVQRVADVVVGLVAQVGPARLLGHVERVGIEARVQRALLCLRPALALVDVLLDQLLVAGLEHVGAPLEEQHPEDVFLELRGIHLASEDVGRLEEVPFELGEREPGHGGPALYHIRAPGWAGCRGWEADAAAAGAASAAALTGAHIGAAGTGSQARGQKRAYPSMPRIKRYTP